MTSNNKPTKNQIILTVLSASGGYLDGFSLLIIASVVILLIPVFKLNAIQIGEVVSFSYLGSFFGAIMVGYFVDRMGRRIIYLLDLSLFIIFSIMSAFSINFDMLLISRILIGIAIGMDLPVSGALIAEFVPPKQRGRLLSTWQMMWVLGALTAPFLTIALLPLGTVAWRYAFGIAAIPAVIILILRTKIPETPRWLLAQGRQKDAKSSATWAAGSSSADLLPSIDQKAYTKENPVHTIFHSKYSKSIGLVSVISAFAAFGPLFLGSYSIYLAKYFGFTSTVEALEFGALVWVFFLIGNIFNFFATDKIGRKPLLIGGALIVTVTLFVASVVAITDIPVILVVFIVAALGHWGGVDQAVWQYPAELYPTEIRGLARGFTTSWIRMSAFISALYTPTLFIIIGFGKTMILFGILEIVVVILSFLLPEVKGKTLEEISGETKLS